VRLQREHRFEGKSGSHRIALSPSFIVRLGCRLSVIQDALKQ
jgi:hypothetical protein